MSPHHGPGPDGNLPIHVTSLGCPKNFVDTEGYLASLHQALGGVTLVPEPEEAKILLVNTCAFIEPAVSESIEVILELTERLKGHGKKGLLVVTGCLVWRYGSDTLQELLPEVDLFFDDRRPPMLGPLISKRFKGPEFYDDGFGYGCDVGRYLAGRPWQRYLKIAEGCSNRCTYCMIPRIRGGLVCRSPQEILAEARALEEAGAQELTVVAQDVTAYRHGDTDLVGLLRTILEGTERAWIRLMYLYPERISRQLIEFMAGQERICPYFDIPVQHLSRRVLRRMGRPYGLEEIRELVRRIRSEIPDASIRTTVMTGFPGEGPEDFDLLLAGIEELRFDHLGCFDYWDEEGSAASRLDDKVPKSVGEERKARVMELQAEIALERNRRFIGRRLEVLVDGPSPETDLLLAGRSKHQAPEVDGVVLINDGTGVPGRIHRVEITEAHEYDLVGAIIA